MVVQSLFIFAVAGCASTPKWSSAGGNRQAGLVRLSYQYPEYRQPEISDAQAEQLALNRCHAWGYEQADPLAGQIRQCANMDGGNCDLWTVTREYQCKTDEGGYASRLSR